MEIFLESLYEYVKKIIPEKRGWRFILAAIFMVVSIGIVYIELRRRFGG